MKKSLKILSVLSILPVLGLTSLFAGCKKDSATKEDILNTYNNMISEYQIQGNTETNNVIFTYSGEVNDKKFIKTNLESVTEGDLVNFDIKLTNNYTITNNIFNSANNNIININLKLNNSDLDKYINDDNYSNYFTSSEKITFKGSLNDPLNGQTISYKLKEYDLDTIKKMIDENYSDSDLKAPDIVAILKLAFKKIELAQHADLLNKYRDLNDIYAKLLNYSNIYFKRYQVEFLNSQIEIDGEKLYALEGKLLELKNAIEEFNTSRKNLISVIEFLGYDTDILISKLNVFNNDYINLINKNFDFNLMFADIHNQYLIKDELVENKVKKITAERIAYESALKYAYGIFVSEILPYRLNNSFDILYVSSVTDKMEILNNLVNGFYTKFGINWKFTNVEKVADQQADKDKIEALNKELVKLFNSSKELINRTDVFLNIYNENIKEIDIYTYNLLSNKIGDRTFYNTLDEYLNTLNANQMARVKAIENFKNYDLDILKDSIENIIEQK